MEAMQFKIKGMNRDNSLSNFGGKGESGYSQDAYEIYNMRVMATENQTTYALTNEKGTKVCTLNNKDLNILGITIGGAVLNNTLYLFTHDDSYTYTTTVLEQYYPEIKEDNLGEYFNVTIYSSCLIGDDNYEGIETILEGLGNIETETLYSNLKTLVDTNNYLTFENLDPLNVWGSLKIIKNYYLDSREDFKITLNVNKIIETSPADRLYLIKFDKDNIVSCNQLFYDGDHPYANLGLSLDHPLDVIPYFESEDILKLYWIDGINQPRMFNVVSRKMIVDFLPEVSSNNEIIVTKKEGGGRFPAGVIQYAFTMGVENGLESNIFYITPLYYLTRDSQSGLPVNEFANCCFEINFKNIDWGEYDYVIAYSILRTALNGEVDCRRVGKFKPDMQEKVITVTEIKTENQLRSDTLRMFPIYIDINQDPLLYSTTAGWPNDTYNYYENKNPYRHYNHKDILSQQFDTIPYGEDWCLDKLLPQFDKKSYYYSDLKNSPGATLNNGILYSSLEITVTPEERKILCFHCNDIDSYYFSSYNISVYKKETDNSYSLVASCTSYGESSAASRDYYNAFNYSFLTDDLDVVILPECTSNTVYKIVVQTKEGTTTPTNKTVELSIYTGSKDEIDLQESGLLDIFQFDDDNSKISLSYYNEPQSGEEWQPASNKIPTLILGQKIESESSQQDKKVYWLSNFNGSLLYPLITDYKNYVANNIQDTENYTIILNEKEIEKLNNIDDFTYKQVNADDATGTSYYGYKYFGVYSFDSSFSESGDNTEVNKHFNIPSYYYNDTRYRCGDTSYWGTQLWVNNNGNYEILDDPLSGDLQLDLKWCVSITVDADTSIENEVNNNYCQYYQKFDEETIQEGIAQKYDLQIPTTLANGKYRVSIPAYWYWNDNLELSGSPKIRLFVELDNGLTGTEHATKHITSDDMVINQTLASQVPERKTEEGIDIDQDSVWKNLIYRTNNIDRNGNIGSLQPVDLETIDPQDNTNAAVYFTLGEYNSSTLNWIDFEIYTGRSINSAEATILENFVVEPNWKISKIGVEFQPNKSYAYTIVLGDIYIVRYGNVESEDSNIKLVETLNTSINKDLNITYSVVNLDYDNTKKEKVDATFNPYQIEEQEKPEPLIKFNITVDDYNFIEFNDDTTQLVTISDLLNLFYGGYYIGNNKVICNETLVSVSDPDNNIYEVTIPLYGQTNNWKISNYDITPFIKFDDSFLANTPNIYLTQLELEIKDIRVEDSRAVDKEPSHVYSYSPYWYITCINNLLDLWWLRNLSDTQQTILSCGDLNMVLSQTSTSEYTRDDDDYGPSSTDTAWEQELNTVKTLNYTSTNSLFYDSELKIKNLPTVEVGKDLEYGNCNEDANTQFTAIYNLLISEYYQFNYLDLDNNISASDVYNIPTSVYIDYPNIAGGIQLYNTETYYVGDDQVIDIDVSSSGGTIIKEDTINFYNDLSNTLDINIKYLERQKTEKIVHLYTENVQTIIDTHDSTQETVDTGHLLITCQRNKVIPQTFEVKNGTMFLGNLEVNVPSVSELTQLILRGELIIQGFDENDNPNTITINDELKNTFFVNSNNSYYGVLLNNNIQQNNRFILDADAEPYSAEELSVFDRPSGGDDGIKIFKGREYYRLGIQLSNNFGEKTDVIDLGYTKINPLSINGGIQTSYPVYTLDENIRKYLQNNGYTKARLMMEEENYENRSILSLGIISPTVFNYSLRSNNAPFAMSSWFFRPFGKDAFFENKHYYALPNNSEINSEIQSVELSAGNISNYPSKISTYAGTAYHIIGVLSFRNFASEARDWHKDWYRVKMLSIKLPEEHDDLHLILATDVFPSLSLTVIDFLNAYWLDNSISINGKIKSKYSLEGLTLAGDDTDTCYLIILSDNNACVSLEGSTLSANAALWVLKESLDLNLYAHTIKINANGENQEWLHYIQKKDVMDGDGNKRAAVFINRIKEFYKQAGISIGEDRILPYTTIKEIKDYFDNGIVNSNTVEGVDGFLTPGRKDATTVFAGDAGAAVALAAGIASAVCASIGLATGAAAISAAAVTTAVSTIGVASFAGPFGTLIAAAALALCAAAAAIVTRFHNKRASKSWDNKKFAYGTAQAILSKTKPFYVISPRKNKQQAFFVDTSIETYHSPNVIDIENVVENNKSVLVRFIGLTTPKKVNSFLSVSLKTGTHNLRCEGAIVDYKIENKPVSCFPGYYDDYYNNPINNQTFYPLYYMVYPWNTECSLGAQRSLVNNYTNTGVNSSNSDWILGSFTKYYGEPKEKIISNSRAFVTSFLLEDLITIPFNPASIAFNSDCLYSHIFYGNKLNIYLGHLDYAYVYGVPGLVSKNLTETLDSIDINGKEVEDFVGTFNWPTNDLNFIDFLTQLETNYIIKAFSDDAAADLFVGDTGESDPWYEYIKGENNIMRYNKFSIWDTTENKPSIYYSDGIIAKQPLNSYKLGFAIPLPLKLDSEYADFNTTDGNLFEILLNKLPIVNPILMRYKSTPHVVIDFGENTKLEKIEVEETPSKYLADFINNQNYEITPVDLLTVFSNNNETILYDEKTFIPIVELYTDPIENNRTSNLVAWIPVGEFINLNEAQEDESEEDLEEEIIAINNYYTFLHKVLLNPNYTELDELAEQSSIKRHDPDRFSITINNVTYDLLNENDYNSFITSLDLTTIPTELHEDVYNFMLSKESDEELDIYGTEGDHFYGRWECLKTYAYNENDVNQVVDIVSVPLESPINLNARTDRNRGVVDNTVMSPKNFNIFNDVYNLSNNFFTYYNSGATDNKVFNNEIVWSLTKNITESLDSWSSITTAATVDLDGTKGLINKLKDWKGMLLAFLDKAITYIPFDQRVAVEATDGVPIEITNAGKVAATPLIIHDNIGCLNKWSVGNSFTSLYFIDNYNKGIFSLSNPQEQPVCLSDLKGFHSWMVLNNSLDSWNPIELNNFKTNYDTINKEVYFVNKDYCLVYNELLGEFTSFYSYERHPYMFNINQDYYTISTEYRYENYGRQTAISYGWTETTWDELAYKNEDSKYGVTWNNASTLINKMWSGNYNSFFGEYKPYYLTLIANDRPLITKIFNTITYTADAFNYTDNNVDLGKFTPYTTFSYIKAEDEYLKGEYLINTKDLVNNPFESDPYILHKKFRIWHIDIPRDGDSIDGYGISGTEPDKTRADRMSNPWLKVTLGRSNDLSLYGYKDRLDLHDITVNYTVQQ